MLVGDAPMRSAGGGCLGLFGPPEAKASSIVIGVMSRRFDDFLSGGFILRECVPPIDNGFVMPCLCKRV